MKKNIIILLLMLTFNTCKDNVIRLNREAVIYEKFPNNGTIIFQSIADYPKPYPRQIHIKDSMLIFVNYGKKDFPWINIINKNTGKDIETIVGYGRGPNEALGISSSGFANNKFWTYDMTKKELWIFDSLINKNPLITRKKIKLNVFKIDYLNDSMLVSNKNRETDTKLDFYNYITNKRIFGSGDLNSLPRNYSTHLKKQFVSSDIKTKPDKSKIAVAYYYFDLIEIYSSNGDLLTAIRGTSSITPKYEIGKGSRGKVMILKPDTRISYLSLYTTNKFIYVTFSGKPMTNKETHKEEGWLCEYLFVFDWNGKPVKKYKLDHPIKTFCIDEKAMDIYSYSMKTGKIIKGHLNRK